MKRTTRCGLRPLIRKARRTSVHAGSEEGSALFEFAMALPLLAMLLVGIIKAGILFYDYVVLADAVASGARVLATNRANANPCTLAQNQVKNAAYNLNTSQIKTTISFPAGAQDSCGTTQSLVEGDAATVAATYPCNMTIPFLGSSFWSSCTLSSQTTVRIE